MKTRTSLSLLALAVLALVAVQPAHAAIISSWNVNGSGVWSDGTKWSAGIPTSAGDTANLTKNINNARTITIDTTSRTLGILNIGDSNNNNSYILAASGGATLTFDNSGSNAQLNQVSGSFGDTLNNTLPIKLNNSLDIRNADADVLTVAGTITANSAGAKTISNLGAGAGAVILSGIIADGGGGTVAVVQNSGTSALTLSGANTYTGNTLISAGTLTLGNNLALQNSAFDTSGAGTLAFATGITTPTFGGLIGSVNLALPSAITALTLNPGTGVTRTYSGNLSGGTAMTLTKSGAGVQVLSGGNTYSGNTTISNGTLQLTGSGAIASSPIINVASGATFDVSGVTGGYTLGASQTLKGNGAVIGPMTAAGTVAPGSSIGTIYVTGTTTLNGTLSVDVETNGTSDLLAVTGNLTLGAGSILSVVDTLKLVSGNTYLIATYTGTKSGTFGGGHNLPGGWSVNYGTGSNSTITLMPEPATLALLGLGGLGLILNRKRR